MPRGAYLLTGHDGPYARERFTCAPGPAGWRYVATREDPATGAPLGRLDVVLDSAGRALRVHVEAGGWELRGGSLGAQVLWRRGDVEREEPAAGFTGTSPVWSVAAARLAGAGPVRLRLVRLGDDSLATLVVAEAWARLDEAVWQADDLATGERRRVQVAGGVVLAAPGVALEELTLT